MRTINCIKGAVEDFTEHLEFSTDPDARVGYKTHIAINDERLITAAIVTTGEKSDGKYLQELIEKSQDAGMEIDTVIGDAAYSEKDNIRYAKENELQLVSKLNPKKHMEVGLKKMNSSSIKMQECTFVKLGIWLFE